MSLPFVDLPEIPLRTLAKVAVKNAYDAGAIKGPYPCSICGKEVTGRSLHAHHESYDLPFRVSFLCSSCHRKRHAQIEWGDKPRTEHRKTGIRGRPRVDAPKNSTIGIRCAPLEKERITRLAERRRMTPSKLGLELFRRELEAGR